MHTKVADIGLAFRADAKAEGQIVRVGGWECLGNTRPDSWLVLPKMQGVARSILERVQASKAERTRLGEPAKAAAAKGGSLRQRAPW